MIIQHQNYPYKIMSNLMSGAAHIGAAPLLYLAFAAARAMIAPSSRVIRSRGRLPSVRPSSTASSNSSGMDAFLAAASLRYLSRYYSHCS